MRFSLIHPSLGRPEQAHACWAAWRGFAHYTDLEHIVSCNQSDPSLQVYASLFNNDESTVIATQSTNMVMASNFAAQRATGDVLILMSDDMFPPQRWDLLLEPYLDTDQPVVLQVHDGIRDDIMTLPIMNRAAYDKLGYLYHPEYLSMFADNDLAETAKAHGMYLVADFNPVIQFEHRHYTNGKAPMDDTYRKENSRVKWDHGQRVFERRKQQGFPI